MHARLWLVLCVLLLAAVPARGQAPSVAPPPAKMVPASPSIGVPKLAVPPPLPVPPPAVAERRVALVVGNGRYQHAGVLPNPANDAADMAAALKDVGFEVILGVDLDKRAFDGKVRDFARALADADAGLVFYAGHGLQVAGQNYLVPVDAKLDSERDLDFEAVRLDFILKQMELERDGKTSIVLLDACRDNPLARNLARAMGTRSAALGKGLAQVQSGVGTFVSFSTQPGNVALDGKGRNSPFTEALVRRVREAGKTLTAVMIDVRRDVLAATAGKQVPWDHSALTGEFYFKGGPVIAAGLPVPPQPSMAATAALEARMRQLEDDLKRKSQLADTSSALMLQQLRDQKRGAELAVRQALMRMNDLQGKMSREKDARARSDLSREVMATQQELGRRNTEIREVAARIASLEAETGAAGPFAGLTRSSEVEGHDLYNATRATGDVIDAGNAGTIEECVQSCRGTPGCVGVSMEKRTGMCELLKVIRGVTRDQEWNAAVKVR